jgi:hypothetical protein
VRHFWNNPVDLVIAEMPKFSVNQSSANAAPLDKTQNKKPFCILSCGYLALGTPACWAWRYSKLTAWFPHFLAPQA